MKDFGIYAIMTDPVAGYRRFLEACVELSLPLVQVRAKELSDCQVLELVRDLLPVTRGTATKIIINDRPDLASLCGAAGYHLGQDDLPPEEARKVWSGGEAVVGLSTHSPDQARKAFAHKPHYIGFGPVYPTPTKNRPDPAVGLEHVSSVVSQAPCPVVVLGGLFPENLEGVLKAGARNVCLVRYFNQAPKPLGPMLEVLSEIRRYHP